MSQKRGEILQKIGYVRVSPISQNPSRQFRQLNEIGMDIIYEEKISGATKDREQLQKMLEDLQEGDIIYVTDLTRITRSTQDLFELIDLIRNKKARLKSLKDTWLDLSDICLALSSQYPLIGIGIPRKLTVPTTLLSTMESMVSIPLIMDLPAIEASIPHTDGKGILTLAVFGIFKINLSLIILCMD